MSSNPCVNILIIVLLQSRVMYATATNLMSGIIYKERNVAYKDNSDTRTAISTYQCSGLNPINITCLAVQIFMSGQHLHNAICTTITKCYATRNNINKRTLEKNATIVYKFTPGC